MRTTGCVPLTVDWQLPHDEDPSGKKRTNLVVAGVTASE